MRKSKHTPTDFEMKLNHWGSTWSYFLANKFGGGGGSSEQSKHAAISAMLRCLKPGQTFQIVVGGKPEGPVRRCPDLAGADCWETYAKQRAYALSIAKRKA